ncbi:hypothetical protein CK498_05610 [Halomonas salipaludis]|uniref:Uncharacterized protein n=2 Tax=Halomonas salipaludis TaxID=2032625 RepID=A0A2A2F0P6_9GAMM|nr:hypothetical protein CK498_05610 [Halomonas salipaludis]
MTGCAALLAMLASAPLEAQRTGWQAGEPHQAREARDGRQRQSRRGEHAPQARPRPRVEVVIPLELLPQAAQPGVPASPQAPDEPLVLDCRALAERLERLRADTTVGTRQLRERRELEARYRRACR